MTGTTNPLNVTDVPRLNRKQLATFIKDPKTLTAFESLARQAVATPPAVNGAQDDATNALDQLAVLVTLDFVILTASDKLTNARVLGGDLGVSLDEATAGQVKIAVNALTILNALATIGFTPPVTMAETLDVTGNFTAGADADVTGDLTVSGALTVSGLTKANGGLECSTLRVDQAPTATATPSDHSIPINVDGTVMYVRLSTAP